MIIRWHDFGNNTFLYVEPEDIPVNRITFINYDYDKQDNTVMIFTEEKNFLYYGQDANELRRYLKAPALEDIRRRAGAP